MLFIGIDLGTSAVKLLLMDEAGAVKNIVSKEYPLYFPHPGWSEQNPEDWYRETVNGLKELLHGFPDGNTADAKHLTQAGLIGQFFSGFIGAGDDHVLQLLCYNITFCSLEGICHVCHGYSPN